MLDLHTIEVSWNSGHNLALSVGYRVVGYKVFYIATGNMHSRSRRQNKNEENSVEVREGIHFAFIEHLVALTEYQFEVAVLADFEGDMTTGERSNPVVATTFINSTLVLSLSTTKATLEATVSTSAFGGKFPT